MERWSWTLNRKNGRVSRNHLHDSDNLTELYLLRYNVVWSGESQSTFRRKISPPPSGLMNTPRRNLHEAGSNQKYACCIRPSKGVRYVPPKCRLIFTGLYGVTSQKAEPLICLDLGKPRSTSSEKVLRFWFDSRAYRAKERYRCGIVRAVSHRLRARVWSCGICGGQSGARAGFLRVLQFPRQFLIPATALRSWSPIIRGWYNRPISGWHTKWTHTPSLETTVVAICMRYRNACNFLLKPFFLKGQVSQ
jgi:hypothetical protein